MRILYDLMGGSSRKWAMILPYHLVLTATSAYLHMTGCSSLADAPKSFLFLAYNNGTQGVNSLRLLFFEEGGAR